MWKGMEWKVEERKGHHRCSIVLAIVIGIPTHLSPFFHTPPKGESVTLSVNIMNLSPRQTTITIRV